MVQNKVLFEDLFCFSTGGWLYGSTVHIVVWPMLFSLIFADV